MEKVFKSPDEWDAGKALAAHICLVTDKPLTLSLEIPDQWQGAKALLQLRVAVRPVMAINYLKADKGYLYYQIALSKNFIARKPITAAAITPALTRSLEETQITLENINNEK